MINTLAVLIPHDAFLASRILVRYDVG